LSEAARALKARRAKRIFDMPRATWENSRLPRRLVAAPSGIAQ